MYDDKIGPIRKTKSGAVSGQSQPLLDPRTRKRQPIFVPDIWHVILTDRRLERLTIGISAQPRKADNAWASLHKRGPILRSDEDMN